MANPATRNCDMAAMTWLAFWLGHGVGSDRYSEWRMPVVVLGFLGIRLLCAWMPDSPARSAGALLRRVSDRLRLFVAT